MSLSHSPRIVTDGLVYCLDAANPKSSMGASPIQDVIAGDSLTSATPPNHIDNKYLDLTAQLVYLCWDRGIASFNSRSMVLFNK